MPLIPAQGVPSRLLVALAFVVLLAAYASIFGAFFPIDDGRLGDDYSLGLTALLDGAIWFRNNGLFETPWFTPSFCAGQPSFADPQNGYFSAPQFLSFLVSPLAAVYLLLVASATGMYWGGYLLMRKVFATGPAVAVLVGGLLMFNGFLPHRMLVGHMSFHAFALTPWLALFLLKPATTKAGGGFAAIAAGVLLAYWVQAGFGTLILAGGLAVVLVALLHALRGGSLTHFAVRGAGATLVALGLSASKLTASLAFLSHFERSYYALPGASSVMAGIEMIGGALFLPSQLAHDVGVPLLSNVQWELAPHEWAFNFGIAVVPLAVGLGIVTLQKSQWCVPSPRQTVLGLAMLLGLLWPLAFNVWSPEWNAFLKTLPVLNSTSAPLRWVIVYIPILAVGLGLLLQRVTQGRTAGLLVAACLGATVLQSAYEPRDFYASQGYDARPALVADSLIRVGKLSPRITTLGTEAKFTDGNASLTIKRNDTFIAGTSQMLCYNPIFGYRLEKFSADNLTTGSVLTERDGFLNLKNPACYVFPAENGCRPGDLFRADQVKEARAFVAYRPFAFATSTRQQIANWITGLTIMAVIVAALVRFGRRPGTIALAALLSIAWLAACAFVAWLICVPLDLPRLLFSDTANAVRVALAKPREAIETTTYFLFAATWFPMSVWYILRRREDAGHNAWFWTALPWVFLGALYLFGTEVTPYSPAAVGFSIWGFFLQFAVDPLLNGASTGLVIGFALLAARGGPGVKRVTELASLAVFCSLAAYAALNIAFVAPTDGYVPTWDSHHKSAVLSPVVDFMLSGETAKSLYGGYYIWAGVFGKLATGWGADPLLAIDGFFFLAVLASFAAFGLAARIGSGSWTPALLALAAAIAFAGISVRGFSYLQIEPIRWLFPALFLAAYAFAMRRSTPKRIHVAGLFALLPFALQWNPETGLACAGALVFSLLALPRAREIVGTAVAGLAAGAIALIGFLAAAKWICASAVGAGPAAPAATGSLFAFAFLDIFGVSMPLFHLWQLVWLISCVLFVAASRKLRGGDGHSAAVQIGAGMTLYLFFYYQGISVPGTLRALAFPLILALCLVCWRALSAPAGTRWSPSRISAAVLILPLAFLAVLAPVNSISPGRNFDPFNPASVAGEARLARAVCNLADKVADGKEVLYLSQDAWWYSLSCGQPFNRGVVGTALVLTKQEWQSRLTRVASAGAVVFEEGMLRFGKLGESTAEVIKVLEGRGMRPGAVKDERGQMLLIYSWGDPDKAPASGKQ